MQVKCKCGKINDVEIDDIIYEVTGKPKFAGDLICSCGQINKVYVAIYHETIREKHED